MYPWVMRTHVCSNAGPHLFSRRDNYELAKIHWQNFKIFSSRTTGQFKSNWHKASLGKEDWVKGIQVCSNEEPLNSHKVNNVFFLLLINIMIYSTTIIVKIKGMLRSLFYDIPCYMYVTMDYETEVMHISPFDIMWRNPWIMSITCRFHVSAVVLTLYISY